MTVGEEAALVKVSGNPMGLSRWAGPSELGVRNKGPGLYTLLCG